MKFSTNILDLGQLTEKVLVFGGVYSNFQALKSLKEIAKRQKILPSNIICTGDIVGYCAQPEECIQFIKDWKINVIMGNVEQQLINQENNCGCNFNKGSRCDNFSNTWYPYAKNKISQSSLKWLQKLPQFIQFQYLNYKCFVLHGSVFNPSEFIFKSTSWKKKKNNFDATTSDVIFAGHSGLPFQHIYKNKFWINAGVIGMPANNGSTKVWYAILNHYHHQIKISHLNFSYNFQSTYNLMVNNKLPIEYAATLKNGIWDNCEILPLIETLLQGKKIIFGHFRC